MPNADDRWMGRAALTGALLAALAAGAFLGGAAPAGAQTVVPYHSPGATGAPIDPGALPAVTALAIPVGGSDVLSLFIDRFPADTSTTDPAVVCDEDPEDETSPGGEICAWNLVVVGNGVSIDSFAPAPGAPNTMHKLSTDNTQLAVTGGNPDTGEVGPIFIGTLGLTATTGGGTVEVQSGGYFGAFLTADPVDVPVTVIAMAATTCPDGTIDAPVEQCDDNNAFAGDGCSADCRLETLLTVQGTAVGDGSVALDFFGTSGPLNIPMVTGEPAGLVVDRVVAAILEGGVTQAAAIVATEGVPDTFFTNEGFDDSSDVSSSDSGIVIFVPEPHAWLGLLSCLAGLAGLGRLRGRP